MKLLAFNFKNDAVWTMIFAFAPVVLGLLTFLIIYLFKFWI